MSHRLIAIEGDETSSPATLSPTASKMHSMQCNAHDMRLAADGALELLATAAGAWLCAAA